MTSFGVGISFLRGKLNVSLYWLWNCQLKSNTWNAEAGPRDSVPPPTGQRPPPENASLSIFHPVNTRQQWCRNARSQRSLLDVL